MILTENTTVDTSNTEVMAGYGLTAFNAASRPVIQNLGPGTLYLSNQSANIATNGIVLPVNAVYEVPTVLMEGAGKIVIRAEDDDCDVRIINVG